MKGHRALLTETVIGDTRDFGIGRRVTGANWRALREVGDHANCVTLKPATHARLRTWSP